jgi:hypothetical protein
MLYVVITTETAPIIENAAAYYSVMTDSNTIVSTADLKLVGALEGC